MSGTRSIRNTAIKAYALGIITGTALTAGTILLSAPAKADQGDELATLVCSSLDRQPTVANVAAILNDLVEFGASPQQAAQVVVISVSQYCTRNIPVAQAFIDTYAPSEAQHKQVGGKVA